MDAQGIKEPTWKGVEGMKLFEITDTMQYDIIKHLMQNGEVRFELNDAIRGVMLDIQPHVKSGIYAVSYYAIDKSGTLSKQISRTNIFTTEIEDGHLTKVKDGVWFLDLTPTYNASGK